jgi:N-acetyl-anhydromuramyl-L-alanine amidase AmpD
MDYLKLVQEKLKPCLFPETQYYKERVAKKSICLHHTAGGSGNSSISGWVNDSVRVATCVVIERDGTILQCFGSQYWAFSLGLDTPNYKDIEKQTIAIEIANYGWLTKHGDEYYNAYGSKVKNVCDLGYKFKGYQYWEAYTPEQIESVKRLLLYWADRYKIDITYKDDIFDLCQRALLGKGGLYTHNSYRSDKSDVYPHPGLIEMLKTL